MYKILKNVSFNFTNSLNGPEYNMFKTELCYIF